MLGGNTLFGTDVLKKKTQRRSNVGILVAVVAMVAIPAAFFYIVQGGSGKSDIPWTHDIDGAFDNASSTGRPVMVDVYTDWCTYCKKMDRETFSDQGVEELADYFVPLKVNGDDHGDFVSRYGIRGYPTVLFLDENGDELHRVEGYTKPSQFQTAMKTALSGS